MPIPLPPLHPACQAYPMLDNAHLQALALDIQTDTGQRDAIVLYRGTLLDGKNRWTACNIAGVAPVTREFGSDPTDGTNPWRYVISKNGARRHLSYADKCFAADAISALSTRGGDGSNQWNNNGLANTSNDVLANPLISQEDVPGQKEAAKLHGIGLAGVQDARVIREDAPDMIAEVRAGRRAIRELATELRARRTAARRAAGQPSPGPRGPRSGQAPAAPRLRRGDRPAPRPARAAHPMPQLTREQIGRPSLETANQQAEGMPVGWTNDMVHTLTHGQVQTRTVEAARQVDARRLFVMLWAAAHQFDDQLPGNIPDALDKWPLLRDRDRRDLPLQLLKDIKGKLDLLITGIEAAGIEAAEAVANGSDNHPNP